MNKKKKSLMNNNIYVILYVHGLYKTLSKTKNNETIW